MILYRYADKDVSRDSSPGSQAVFIYQAVTQTILTTYEVHAGVIIGSAAGPAAPAGRGLGNGLIFEVFLVGGVIHAT